MPDYNLPYEVAYERECARMEALDRAQEREFHELLEDDETYTSVLDEPEIWEGVKAFLRDFQPFISKVDAMAWERVSP